MSGCSCGYWCNGAIPGLKKILILSLLMEHLTFVGP